MGILTQKRLQRISALGCALFCLFLPAIAAAQEKPLQLYEQKIKAGLVYNFLKYTNWPGDLAGNLNVCLFGGDPFEGYLSPLEGRTAQQYKIAITQIRQVQQAADCHVVVIHRNEQGNLPDVLKFLKDKHVLTISDIDNFARQGGMVEMTKEGGKINLYINTNAVGHAGLGIADPMLQLAKLVPG